MGSSNWVTRERKNPRRELRGLWDWSGLVALPGLGGLGLLVEGGEGFAEFFPVLDDGLVLAGAVEDVELALDHLGDGFAGGAEVVAGVELGGLGGEDFADLGSHGEAEVGVDVDLADAVLLDGHGDLVLGDALGVGHGAAVLVDQVDELLGDAG